MKELLEIEPGYEPVLRAAGLTHFEAFMGVQGGPPAGRHRHRETVPLDLDVDGRTQQFYMKRVFSVPPKHAFWPLLRGQLGRSQPCREWHMLAELERAGIPAMQRVAFGERRRFGMPREAFLLVEAVPMKYTLEHWLLPGFPKTPPIDKRLRDHLWFELGMLIRRLYEANLDWPDLRAKHIFAEPGATDNAGRRWEFRLIDVERMNRGARGSLKSPFVFWKGMPGLDLLLIGLCNDLRPMGLGPSDALRLLAGACLTDGRTWPPRGRGTRFEKRDLRGVVRLLTHPPLPRQPDDPEHGGRDHLQDRNGFHFDAPQLPWLRAAGFQTIEDVFRHQAGQHLAKPGLSAHRDRIRLDLALDGGERRVFYVKRYRRPPWQEQLRRIREWRVFRSSAGREEHYARKLAALGIPTPRTVAYGEEMQGLWEHRSFIVTQEIKGTSLERIAAEASRTTVPPPPLFDRREIIRQLAAVTRCLHQASLFHRDLYLSHVFLTRNADNRIVLYLIDLARVIRAPWRPERWRIKDLAALDYSAPLPLVTRADRLRFLYHYLGLDYSLRNDWRRQKPARKDAIRNLIRPIQGRVRRIARHDARRQARFQGAAQA